MNRIPTVPPLRRMWADLWHNLRYWLLHGVCTALVFAAAATVAGYWSPIGAAP